MYKLSPVQPSLTMSPVSYSTICGGTKGEAIEVDWKCELELVLYTYHTILTGARGERLIYCPKNPPSIN